jgi:hypothetical protein
MKIYFFGSMSEETRPCTSEETPSNSTIFSGFIFLVIIFSSYVRKDPPGGEKEHRPHDHDNSEEEGAQGLATRAPPPVARPWPPPARRPCSGSFGGWSCLLLDGAVGHKPVKVKVVRAVEIRWREK